MVRIEPLKNCVFARRWMVLAALLLAAGACSRPELELADGTGTSWSAWEGQWLVINYWAEWCAPCRKEIPELNRLHAETDVVVLGVNFDGLQNPALSRLIEEMNVEFPVLTTDPRLRWDLPLPTVLPSTLVINPDGELHDVLVGPQTYESLAHAVELSVET